MSKLTIIIPILLLSINLSVAQKIDKVTVEMLQESVHPLEPDASAAYLQKSVKIYYDLEKLRGIDLIYKHKYFIKVYKEEGKEYGTISLPCYNKKGDKEEVSKIKCKTHNLVEGKIKTTKIDKKNIFKEKTTDNWTQVKIAMPNVKIGSVLEIDYEFSSPFIYSISKWYFQNYIPTNYSSMSIDVPSYFSLTPVPTGLIPLESDRKDTKNTDHAEKTHTFFASNIPSVKKDKYVLNENDYRSGLKYELRSTHFPNDGTRYYSKDWNEIAKNLTDDKHFGEQIRKNLKSLSPIIDEALQMETGPRIGFLYDYVKNNYAWNDKYERASYKELKNVVKDKIGSSGDLNLLFLNLLKRAKIPAYPLLIKQRASGQLNASYPSLTELNYVIIYIPNGDGYILADASYKLSPLGELPVRAISYSGLLVDKDIGQIIKFENPNTYKLESLGTYTFNTEEKLIEGKLSLRRRGYAATTFRQQLIEKENEGQETGDDGDEDEDEDSQEADIENINIEDESNLISVKNIENIYQPISLEYEEKLKSCSKMIEDKIFIDAALDFGITKNPFIEETRDYPVFYQNTILIKNISQITIPEGYIVESLPEPSNLAIENKKAVFNYEVKETGGKLLINYQFKVNESIILNYEYESLKQLYQLVIKKATEKIILAKE